MSDTNTKMKVTLDGDKGMYTQQEVADLLRKADIVVGITQPDGKVSPSTVEEVRDKEAEKAAKAVQAVG